MNLVKKIAAVVVAAALSVGFLSMSAFADPFEDAVAISSGEEAKGTLERGGSLTYEITSKGTGNLVVNWSVGKRWTYLHVFDEDGAYLNVESLDVKAGSLRSGGEGKNYIESNWNSTSERFSASATYKVTKGTFYITVSDVIDGGGYSAGEGAFKITADFPTKTSTDLSYLGITMKKGDTMQLDSVGVSSSKAKWTSSKKTVASVTAKGVVTAKKKGTTVISCTYNGKTVKLKVTVK